MQQSAAAVKWWDPRPQGPVARRRPPAAAASAPAAAEPRSSRDAAPAPVAAPPSAPAAAPDSADGPAEPAAMPGLQTAARMELAAGAGSAHDAGGSSSPASGAGDTGESGGGAAAAATPELAKPVGEGALSDEGDQPRIRAPQSLGRPSLTSIFPGLRSSSVDTKESQSSRGGPPALRKFSLPPMPSSPGEHGVDTAHCLAHCWPCFCSRGQAWQCPL